MSSRLILPGFNPDPSICRVGDDHYIATSTFEWYPGVQIHRSRDLSRWELVARPLAEARLLDLTGVPDSGGVWAPDLSYADGRFWLVYTIVRRLEGRFKDTHNYLTTAPSIDGPWSDRVFLNSSGFDPSLFHDGDGSKWLTNMVWDYRPGRHPFAGIAAQRYDPEARQLIGEPAIITRGTGLGCTEGPHLYRHDGRYHLMLAEGGTGYDHAVTTMRADALLGPYSADPAGPLITSAGDDDAPLHRMGHGSLVETADGRWFVAHLASRSLPGARRSPMGRESAIAEVRWSEDGWLRLAEGAGDDSAPETEDRLYGFDAATLDPDFQWLRTPDTGRLFSLTERPGVLRLYGREAIGSAFESALVARRRTGFGFVAETEIDCEPVNFQQMAGLVLYYNGHKHHYCYISRDESVGRHLAIMSNPADLSLMEAFPLGDALVPLADGPVRLRATVDGDALSFAWAQGTGDWRDIGPSLDAAALADETGKGEGASFTGTFVGVCAQDLSGRGGHADVSWFRYRSTNGCRS